MNGVWWNFPTEGGRRCNVIGGLFPPLQVTDRLLRHADQDWAWMVARNLTKPCMFADQVDACGEQWLGKQ